MTEAPSGIVSSQGIDGKTDRIIPASVRPDGSIRPARRVRDGFTPAEDRQVYKAPGARVATPTTSSAFNADNSHSWRSSSIPVSAANKYPSGVVGLVYVNEKDNALDAEKKLAGLNINSPNPALKEVATKRTVMNSLSTSATTSSITEQKTVTENEKDAEEEGPLQRNRRRKVLRKLLRACDALMSRPIEELDSDQRTKLARRAVVLEELEALGVDDEPIDGLSITSNGK